jgi:hypothetical protein
MQSLTIIPFEFVEIALDVRSNNWMTAQTSSSDYSSEWNMAILDGIQPANANFSALQL